jgi:hypothetical protein
MHNAAMHHSIWPLESQIWPYNATWPPLPGDARVPTPGERETLAYFRIRQEWEAMDGAARAPYVEAAAADKACYERKMLAYQPICDQCWPAPLMESSGDEYTDYDGWDDCG